MPYGSFGDLVFEVVEYFSHTEEHPYIYARHDTIYPPSTTQWMGRELQKITLKLKFHTMTSSPSEALSLIKELAEKGEAQKLIIAEQVLGDFVIDKIKAEYKQVDLYGNPVLLELELELTEYVKKELQKIKHKKATSKKKQAQKKATQSQTPQYKGLITRDKDGNRQFQKG